MNWQKIHCKLGKHEEEIKMTQPLIDVSIFRCVINYQAYMGCKHCNFTRPLTPEESAKLRSMVMKSFDDILGRRGLCPESTGSKSNAE